MTTTTTIETISPTKAKEWLTHNTPRNRRLRQHKVDAYADQMTRGQWLMAGDPIRFDSTGALIDGQHRLAAVVQTGKSRQMVVVRGLDPAAFGVIDTGMIRNPADSLGVGVTQATSKAAAARVLYLIETGCDPRNKADADAVTRLDIVSYYQANAAQMDTAMLQAQRTYSALPTGNQTAWLVFVTLANRINAQWTADFLEAIVTGANLEHGDPRLSLRNWLSNVRSGAKANARAAAHLGVYIKAWNSWLAHQSRSLMVLRDDEPFPELATRQVRRGTKP